MPPKNKGSSKKPPKVKTPTLIDGLTKEEISKEQMEEHIVHLREELDREREERNYFQLERDKIRSFFEITERQLQEVKAELKTAEKDIEEDEERHQVELKVYKQKMKHLLCEHQNTISELKADGSVSTQQAHKEQEKIEAKLDEDMRATKIDMQELDSENIVKELELKHEEEMTETRNTCEKQLAEIKAKYKKKMELLPQELDNMRRKAVSEAECRWSSHIKQLKEDHDTFFSEQRKELAKGMQQDMDLIESLMSQIEEMKTSRKEKKKDTSRLLQDNKRLTELLTLAGEENVKIEKKIKHPPTKNATEKEKQKQLDDLKRDYETLDKTFRKLQLETDELHKSFTENIQKVQHKAGLKSTELDRKLKDLTEHLETTQAQLSSVLSASNMDQTALYGLINTVEEKLNSSSDSIRDLQYKKAQISQARKNLLLYWEAKQRALGVPVEELRVEPSDSMLTG